MTSIGLDIGGANLKGVRLSRHGAIRGAATEAFPLWQAPDRLPVRLHALIEKLGPAEHDETCAVTMTAELCDAYPDRAAGVRAIVRAAMEAWRIARPGAAEPGFWTVDGRFASEAALRADPLAAASANWHALATMVASLRPAATLLLDMGSTTTDLIPLRGGSIATDSRTDFDRLASGELVYLGLTRTPLASLGPAVEVDATVLPVLAEWFADLGDVAVLLDGEAAPRLDHDAADRRGRDRESSAARVLRSVGLDLAVTGRDAGLRRADQLAQAFRAAAARRITASPLWSTDPGATDGGEIVLAGAGAAWLASMLRQTGAHAATRATTLAEIIGDAAAEAAPAWAVANLGRLAATGDPR